MAACQLALLFRCRSLVLAALPCGYEYVSILYTKYGVRAHQSVLQYSSTPYRTSYSERIGSVGLTIYVDEVRQTSQHNPPGEQTGHLCLWCLVSWMPWFIYIPQASRQSHVFTHFPVNKPWPCSPAVRTGTLGPARPRGTRLSAVRGSGGSWRFFFFRSLTPIRLVGAPLFLTPVLADGWALGLKFGGCGHYF